jgi:hypothetical protein
MLILSHPTGNTFVRALLSSLEEHHLLKSFYTSVAVQREDWRLKCMPQGLREELLRRTYDIPENRIIRFPVRELIRLAASRLHAPTLTKHETGIACVDAVYADLDSRVAKSLLNTSSVGNVSGVYCYEDCALQTFRAAKKLGLRCCYDLPIAYWQTIEHLLEEEAARWPAWEPTLVGTRDSQAKRQRRRRN